MGIARLRGEDGAVAIVAAISLMAMLMMSAVVIDLGFLRSDRIANQSVSDMAATAGAVDYRPGVPGSAQQACIDALAFAADNLDLVFNTVTATSACTSAFPTSFDESCDPADPQTALYDGGTVRIAVTIPVPDDDPRMEQHLSRDDAFDGHPCQRIGVQVERDRSYFFGGITGIAGATPSRGAVARSLFGDEESDYASLIVLRRGPTSDNCQVLVAGGGSEIRVLNVVRDEPTEDDPSVTEEVTYPGNITVDTVTPCSPSRLILANDTNSSIFAEGDLTAHSLQSTDAGNSFTYQTGDVSSGRVTQPIPGPRITRAPVDHPYNCHPSGYPSGFDWSPQRFGQDIGACEGSTPPYVRNLQDDLGAVTAANAAARGFAVFPADFAGYSCTNNGSLAAITAATAGSDQLFVDCDVATGQGFVAGGGNLTFDGFRHIVFRRALRNNNSGTLAIRGPSSTGTVAYVQSGSFDLSNGTNLFENTFVYIQGTSTATSGNTMERFAISGSSGARYAHLAPLDRDACTQTGGVPNAACFAPLALWSNGRAPHVLQGENSRGGIAGSVFTPNAPTRLRTSGSDTFAACGATPSFSDLETDSSDGLNLEAAQFFAESIENRNGGILRMCPNPDTQIEIPLRGVNLIR